MNYNKKKVIIWDSLEKIPNVDSTIILWNSHLEFKATNVFSIFDFIDQNCDYLRNQYISFIWEIGESLINNKEINKHLIFRDNLSFWWLTMLTEKSIYKSPHINDVIKLFAIEKFLKNSDFEIIELNSCNYELSKVLKNFTYKNSYKFQDNIDLIHKYIIPNLKIPYFLEFIYLFISSIFSNLLFYKKNKICLSFNKNQVSFFDYFLNFKQDAKDKYDSDYWRSLNVFLKNSNTQINYYHIFIGKGLKSKKEAIKKINSFNKIDNETHQLINLVYCVKVIYHATLDYLKILPKIFKIRKIKFLFIPQNSTLDLWPLYKNEWFKSTIGSTAFRNLLLYNYFEKELINISYQQFGVFLYENQNWEIALTHAWKKSNHGTLIASAHSTVRFWDFRYFQHNNFHNYRSELIFIKPNIYAFNGSVSYNIAKKSNYPKGQIREVEALRYLSSQRILKHYYKKCKIDVLICGDYNLYETNKLLKMIEEIYNKLPNNYYFTFKPHPADKLLHHTSFPLVYTNKNLMDTLNNYEIIVTTNSTSAVIDAYVMNINVLQLINYKSLNFSPLYNINNSIFFYDSEDLLEKLITLTPKKEKNNDFFYTDITIPKWKNLINENC
jgi:surface carbohydrate biosynthesis protein (TIGR04326 family)